MHTYAYACTRAACRPPLSPDAGPGRGLGLSRGVGGRSSPTGFGPPSLVPPLGMAPAAAMAAPWEGHAAMGGMAAGQLPGSPLVRGGCSCWAEAIWGMADAAAGYLK